MGGLFGGDESKSSSKPTLLTQIGAGSLIGQFLPWGSGAIEGEQAGRAYAGGEMPTAGSLQDIGYNDPSAPYRRYSAEYNPYAFNTHNNQRPGGASQYESGLLNRSLYGSTAPLQMGGMENANQQYQTFLQSMYGGGGGQNYGQGGQQYGSPYPEYFNDPQSQAGRSYNAQTGQWNEVQSGADVTWDAGTGQYYYRGTPITESEVQAGLQGGPKAIETMLMQRMGGPGGSQAPIEMFGQQALNAIGLGNEYYQRPPDRPNFDAADYGIGMLDRLQGNGALDKYVQNALSGTRGAFQKEMADQLADLKSQYAYEGGYLGSPMFSAMGELQGGLTAEYLRDIGKMELDAANAQMDRMYGFAGQGMGTQADFLGNTYGTEMDAFSRLMSDTSGARASIINNAMNLMEKGYATNYDQAYQMATALQENEQTGLDSLQENYYRPGENMLELLNPLFGIGFKSKSKSESGGGLGGLLGGAGDLAMGASMLGLI